MPDIQTPIQKYVADRPFSTLPASASVAEAVDALHRSGSDSVLVTTDRGSVEGIFTEQDFLQRVIAEGREPRTTLLSDVMTEAPDVLRPQAPISYAVNLMALQGFRSIPVVDEDGRAVAILGVRDVIQHLSDLLGELEELPDENPSTSSWIDIGGGD